MKMLNQVKITFAGRSVNEGFARAALAAFLVQLDPTVPQLADMKTAVSEAVTNCIVHAYPDKIGPITMTAAIYEGGIVRITITDRGVGIPRAVDRRVRGVGDDPHPRTAWGTETSGRWSVPPMKLSPRRRSSRPARCRRASSQRCRA